MILFQELLMAGRIANGWNLAKQSCAVLAADKKLLIFPMISSVACLIVLASFLLPIAFAIDWQAVKNSQGSQVTAKVTPVYYAMLFAMYLVNYFVIIFFNSALVACV